MTSTTIILPNSQGLSDNNSSKIKKWIKNGGALIAYKNSLKWVGKTELVKYNFKENNRTAKNIILKKKVATLGLKQLEELFLRL